MTIPIISGMAPGTGDMIYLKFEGNYAILSYASETGPGTSTIYAKEGTAEGEAVPGDVDVSENQKRLEAAKAEGAVSLGIAEDYAGWVGLGECPGLL